MIVFQSSRACFSAGFPSVLKKIGPMALRAVGFAALRPRKAVALA
jgi:hypothetical protein